MSRPDCPADPNTTGTVVAFPEPQHRPRVAATSRLTLRDRVETMRWVEALQPDGIARAAIHTSGEPGIGDFILIYLPGALWASWVVGCKAAGYCVWRAGSGADLGCFPALGQALAAVEALL